MPSLTRPIVSALQLAHSNALFSARVSITRPRLVTAIFAALGSPPGQPEQVDKILAYLCPPEPQTAPMF